MAGTPRIPDRIVWAVEQVAAKPSDRLLEIGCGGGHAVARLCRQVPRATIAAIDRSALQVERARERNRDCIASGRVRIERLPLVEAPDVLGERAFTRVLAINVNAFWTAPAPSIASLWRLLRPGGRAYLAYEPPSAASSRRVRASMQRLIAAHGLTVEDVREATFRSSTGLCLVARRAG